MSFCSLHVSLQVNIDVLEVHIALHQRTYL